MDSTAKQAALELAQELDGELGGGVAAALQDENSSRTFGVGEAAALAGLIMGAVQMVMQHLSDKKMANLQAYLEEHLPKSGKVSQEKRATVIRNVLRKFGAGA
jgi:hypothetical protein